jgi:hypothetical protein
MCATFGNYLLGEKLLAVMGVGETRPGFSSSATSSLGDRIRRTG